MNEFDSAFEIAAKNLRECYSEKGIVAGKKNFNEYWARDSFFACLGANSLKDFEIVKKNLELFFKFQKKSGKIPFHISKKLKPSYRFFLSNVVDSNSLIIIALQDYLEKSNDVEFAEKNFEKAKKAMEWLEKQDKNKDFLIEEGIFANWMDSILKFGKVLYSNVCHLHSLECFAKICRRLKKEEMAKTFSEKFDKTKNALNQTFWNGSYYIDWIDFSKQDFFSSDGNVLAVFWNIADQLQAETIENKIKQHQLNKIPLKTNYPAYPFWRVPLILLPLQAYHYHNGFSWQWLGCLNAFCLKKIGFSDDAKKELKKNAMQILENHSTHEVFSEEGKPVESIMLKSEHPFAWSAAAYILAYNEIKK